MGSLPPRSVVFALLLAACAAERAPEGWEDWFDEGTPNAVAEAVAFTDQAYDFPAPGEPGIGDLFVPGPYKTAFGAGDEPPPDCRDWESTSELPVEIEGMVTIHPRFYFKTIGCVGSQAPNGSADEKYYGSYFIQDATGGIFVLGDSKVAHFDMGDRVRMRVRAMRNRFDLPTVAVHDIVEVKRGPEPIYFEVADTGFSADDIGLVKRITGTVTTEKDTFGEFRVESDDGVVWAVGLDVELNRRGIDYPVGTEVRITGPVMYSYSVYTLVVMRVGQVEVLRAASAGDDAD